MHLYLKTMTQKTQRPTRSLSMVCETSTSDSRLGHGHDSRWRWCVSCDWSIATIIARAKETGNDQPNDNWTLQLFKLNFKIVLCNGAMAKGKNIHSSLRLSLLSTNPALVLCCAVHDHRPQNSSCMLCELCVYGIPFPWICWKFIFHIQIETFVCEFGVRSISLPCTTHNRSFFFTSSSFCAFRLFFFHGSVRRPMHYNSSSLTLATPFSMYSRCSCPMACDGFFCLLFYSFRWHRIQ